MIARSLFAAGPDGEGMLMGDTPLKVMEFDAALALVLEHAAKVAAPAAERVKLSDSLKRVLATEVRADRDQPPFDRATRDGFAVRASDVAAGKTLRVVGQVRAGEQWTGAAVGVGSAVEIMTGAPMPEGADAALMVEHVSRSGDSVQVAGGPWSGRWGEFCASWGGGSSR